MKKIILGTAYLLAKLSLAHANIAIIDSGVDIKHFELRDKIWINPIDRTVNEKDEDSNGFVDDVYGWNFAENNREVIDYKFLGGFSEDVYLFFEIQGKMIDGTASSSDEKWMDSKRTDQAFHEELNIFGNFVHGTHVAGISSQLSTHSKILTVKLIPTTVDIPEEDQQEVDEQLLTQEYDEYVSAPKSFRIKIIKGLLQKMAAEEMDILTNIAQYIHSHHSKIANGSFGTGYPQAQMVSEMIYNSLYKENPTKSEIHEMAIFMLKVMIEKGDEMAQAAPETLFIFAAGNEGTNNDKYPSHPANVSAPNVMSVAATYQNIELAPFSNYGRATVDVAAPGVNISSFIPGDEKIKLSGTSQAAPFVSGVASEVQRINPNLHPAQIKKLLMSTVDKKSWLNRIIKSGGVVNPERAYVAATKSLEMSLAKAIKYSIENIKDQLTMEDRDSKSFNKNMLRKVWVPALPSPFRIK